jgi:hypothetical protein
MGTSKKVEYVVDAHHLGNTVYTGNKKIVLQGATQKDLKFLFELGQVGVNKVGGDE